MINQSAASLPFDYGNVVQWALDPSMVTTSGPPQPPEALNQLQQLLLKEQQLPSGEKQHAEDAQQTQHAQQAQQQGASWQQQEAQQEQIEAQNRDGDSMQRQQGELLPLLMLTDDGTPPQQQSDVAQVSRHLDFSQILSDTSSIVCVTCSAF